MAIMWDTILKNVSGSPYVIDGLGLELATGGQLTASEQFTYEEMASSDGLRQAVLDGDIVVNDGTADLSAADGNKYLTFVHQNELEGNYYSKTELQTPGSSIVNWDNVTNKPTYGVDQWSEPVNYRVTGMVSAAPAGPATDDVYLDTDDDHFYKWNGTAWQDLGAAADGDRVIDLSDADESEFLFDGSTWTDGGVPTSGVGVSVTDDGDGKTSIYVYNQPTTSWIKISDVDFVDHHNDGGSKHDADQIDVEGTYTNLGAPGDAETIFNNLDTVVGDLKSGTYNNTLDEAYDQDGAGAGRSITVDSGPVVLDASAGTDAPLQLTPTAIAPTTNLADGQVTVGNDGRLYVYDASRSKWLSAQRHTLVFGRRGNSLSQYLAYSAGNLASNNSGIRLAKNATITMMASQLDASGSCDMHVRRNDALANIATININATTGNSSDALNVDVNVNDYLQCAISATTAVQDPIVIIEYAYRM
jgi:hypothetical protein